MKLMLIVLTVTVLGYVNCYQKCQGSPRMYNGKRCASTTRYADYHKGACGCGPASGDSQFGWNHDHYVTAPNQKFFDEGNGGWCGQRCGICVKLTTTGGWVPGQGGSNPEGVSQVFMVTNLCPNVYPNQNWCNQETGPNGNGHNDYGYVAHFDLENGANQISRINWNNPEVTFKEVSCHGFGHEYSNTPTDGMYHQCQCSHHGKRALNETLNNSEN